MQCTRTPRHQHRHSSIRWVQWAEIGTDGWEYDTPRRTNYAKRSVPVAFGDLGAKPDGGIHGVEPQTLFCRPQHLEHNRVAPCFHGEVGASLPLHREVSGAKRRDLDLKRRGTDRPQFPAGLTTVRLKV